MDPSGQVWESACMGHSRDTSDNPMADAVRMIAVELHHVALSIGRLSVLRLGHVTPAQFNLAVQSIMSAISEYASRQSAFNARLDTAIAGVTADVAGLVAKIEELQNTPGAITPEDQALLDEIETRSEAITVKLEALDALTPPPVPAG